MSDSVIKWTELPSAGSLSGAEITAVVQSGVSVKATVEAFNVAHPYVYAGSYRSGNASVGTVPIDYAGGASSPLNSGLWLRSYCFGTATPDSNDVVSPYQIVFSDNVNTGYMTGVAMIHATGGAGSFGGRTGVLAQMNVVGPSTPVDGFDSGMTAHVSQIFSQANQGGNGIFTTDPATGWKGGVCAGNDNARLASGATYQYDVFGREIDVSIEDGASAYAKIGLFVVKPNTDSHQGFADDAAIAISDQFNNNVPWKKGISFGVTWGQWPFDSTSTLIGAQRVLYPDAGSPPANYGIDFRDITFATKAFASSGFSVGPDGAVVAKSFTPGSVPTITGSRGANAALASLLTNLAALGLIVDGTS